MLQLVDRLAPWLGPGQLPFAVATVVAASGSVPRPVGTAMAVRADGAVLGSLSGGCVEAAVHAAALDAIAVGACHRETFGYADEDAFAVGLSCGGTLEVHVQPVLPGDAAARALAALARGASPAALVRRIDGERRTAVLLDPDGDDAALARALAGLVGEGAVEAAAAQVRAVLRAGGTATVRAAHAGPGPEPAGPDPTGPEPAGPAPGRESAALPCDAAESPVTLLVETVLPAPRFLVVGANDFAGALVRGVRSLGYRVTLVDAREVFADARRFPEADEVVVEWPDRYLAAEAAAGRLDARTGIAVLTHDAKVDVPVLRRALDLPLAYVGAMGSRRSHDQRVRALRAEGVPEAALGRLRSPIGLDLGAVTPEEVAVSVTAEIVATRHGRDRVAPLSHGDGPLHVRPRAVGHDGAPGAPRADRPSAPEETPGWT